MDDKRIIEVTADGSHTLFVPALNEHYHSVNGAVQESKHVFMEAGFRQVISDSVRILEIGFGTGLNALLTLLEARGNGKQIEYYTIEAYPLPKELTTSLNYTDQLEGCSSEELTLLHSAPWNSKVQIFPEFMICKIEGDSNKVELPSDIDLVYFDAFAPDKQPEMWNQEIFDKIYNKMNPDGIITTYCAKGVVRRMMQTAGFIMERIPGPPGKREMLRGRKII